MPAVNIQKLKWRCWLTLGGLCVIATIIVWHAAIPCFFVARSMTMWPSIAPGDVVLIKKTETHDLARWSVVVYKLFAESNIISIARVVGLPSESILVTASNVLVTGVSFQPPGTIAYQHNSTAKYGVEVPVSIPKDSLFLVADNSAQSIDSRMLGPITISQVEGKVIHVFHRQPNPK